MGRARRLKWIDEGVESWRRLVGLFRRLMDGRTEERPSWSFDSVESVIATWPVAEDAAFFHLSRLYRYGFRLKSEPSRVSLYQFFADGEIYRPEAGFGKNKSLGAALVAAGGGKAPLRLGQCRTGRAQPVLDELGFSELDSSESHAIQFVGPGRENWIFIDTRPDLFRREVSAVVAAKLATLGEGSV